MARIAQAATARHGGPMSFEASGYYMYHPFAMERLARDMPGVKLVVMLRDPVERAFSAYKHEYARGYEWESFEKALELEDERLVGEIDRMRADRPTRASPTGITPIPAAGTTRTSWSGSSGCSRESRSMSWTARRSSIGRRRNTGP